jgi:hypothetical protein
LTATELTSCLIKAPWFSYFAPTGINSASLIGFGPNEGEGSETLESIAADMIYAVDSDNDGLMNFAEYMFLRKSAVAWKKCIPGNLMAENEAKCAIEIAANNRFLES